MKTTFTLAALLFCATVFGQAWVPIGTKWVFEQPILGSGGFLKIKVECIDTLLFHDKMCSKLEYKDTWCSYLPDSVNYLYAENKEIFVWKDTSFHLLYDFNTPLYSSWQIKMDFGGSNYTSNVFVVGVDTLLYAGQKKRIFLIQLDNPAFYLGSYIIEDIGSSTFIYPQLPTCDPQVTSLKCFYRPDFGNYGSTDCIVSTENLFQKKNDFSINPNPSNGLYLIENQRVTPENRLEVFDFSGVKIRDFGQIEPTFSLDLTEQPSGIFFVKLTSRDGYFSVKKIVKN
jgi:Secretion system C-terminal sorting domain